MAKRTVCALSGALLLLNTAGAAEWGHAVKDAREARLLEEGVVAAEALRLDYCRTRVHELAALIASFRDRAGVKLEGRQDLRRFPQGTNWIVQAVCAGSDSLDGTACFDGFAGKWFGQWEAMQVDHHWHPTLNFRRQHRIAEVNGLLIHAVQYAWIGDGFGWNLIASPKATPDVQFVLGTVYHVENGDPERVRLNRPHLGVVPGPGKLLWITRGEVFFEEIHAKQAGRSDRYSITGFDYEWDGEQPRIRGQAFQAVYTRDAQDRPTFYRFNVE